MMQVTVELIEGPLSGEGRWGGELPSDVGAVIRFEGVVRRMEAGQRLSALAYEQYPPMTERELHRLASEVGEAHGLLAIRVTHSYGKVPVGAVSFRLEIASAHRAEGIKAMDVFIDRLKREVPLWKVAVWEGEVSSS
ncbi:molybdenum cofactor biosynthesis protein MoaE [Phycisphaerales bacterium AB-hyl4]|uniref:Molybdopterin synthase catalytic subunit n=1 Tax=Natronomicrosphaera hydrolytica TaxID=3242702 RepID=A0ABV4U3H2_9BACT